MSAHAEARSRKLADRAVILAAVAGLAGLAITVTATGVLMFNGGRDPIRATVDQSNLLQPGYVDYGLRQPTAADANQQPAYVDFGLRHPSLLPAAAAANAAGASTRADDYGVRCVATGWCSVYPGNPQPRGMGTH
jgi:hypothetical protein